MAGGNEKLRRAAESKTPEDIVSATEMMRRARDFCVEEGGYFVHDSRWEFAQLANTGDADTTVVFTCGFGPHACNRLASNHPERYIVYDGRTMECVDMSPERDMCEMANLREFCTAHPSLCFKQTKQGVFGPLVQFTYTGGLHHPETTKMWVDAVGMEALQDRLKHLSRVRPMQSRWDYASRSCNITRSYCHSVGWSHRTNSAGFGECYIRRGQQFFEDLLLGETLTRRIRVLGQQLGSGDMTTLANFALIAGAMALSFKTGGLSLALIPWAANVPTISDSTNPYAHTRSDNLMHV